MCEVFQEGDTCSTISLVHENTCTLRHILDESLLTEFALKNCAAIIGGLAIDNLPRHLDEDDLHAAFWGLHTVIGTLTVSDNAYLTSLSFLANLKQVNRIIVHNNPMIVDARLPSLDVASLDEDAYAVHVSNNPRLHPSYRYPLSSTDPDVICFNCPHLTATFSLQVKSFNSSFSTHEFLHLMSHQVLDLNDTEVVSARIIMHYHLYAITLLGDR